MSATKTFETLRAKCALVGIILLRTDPADGPVRLLAVREGRVRMLHNIDDLEALVGSPAGGLLRVVCITSRLGVDIGA